MRSRIFSFFIALGLCLFFWGVAFASSSNDHKTVNTLEHSGSYQQIILSLPEEQYQRDKQTIALDPQTEHVDIVAQDIRFAEEAESFAKHRRHYVAFWSLFLFMFGLDILWAE